MKPCRWLRPILTLAVLAVFLAAPLVASAGQPDQADAVERLSGDEAVLRRGGQVLPTSCTPT